MHEIFITIARKYQKTTVARLIQMVNLNKIDALIIETLKKADKDLTLAEIAERTGIPEKKVFTSLRKLFENEIIDCENRRYRLAKK
ncbi:MAG: winged helix-turn-helix transcriptional regulator [Candidatus Bathyarchaeales archaeon]